MKEVLRGFRRGGVFTCSGAAAPVLLTGAIILAGAFPERRASASPEVRSAGTGAGQRVRLQGELETYYEDAPRGGRLLHFLSAGGERLAVRFASDPPTTLPSGARVSVEGVRDGGTLTLDSGGSVTPLDGAAPAAAANSFGEHRVLVILVNFQDKQAQPFTVEQARRVAFDTTSDFYRESSYGQTWLTGDVFGWFTIPVGSTTCDTAAIASYARQAAADAGADLAAYDHHVYAFPGNACSFTGRGSVGGSPSQAWINEWFEPGIVGHELGHNFGLFHSRSMDCGAAAVGGSCTTEEYGDTLDTMGAADTAHFNLFQKEQLGWVNYGGSPPLQTVTGSGTYYVDAYERPGANPKGLKILKSTDPATGRRTWYYVERRTATGFDGFLSGNANVLGGVVVHTGSEASGQANYLLDMTPATVSWYDPALVVGQSFGDPEAGVTITTIAADAAGAMVSVTLAPPPCPRANPSVTLSPPPGQWGGAGATSTFTVTVRNNEAGGCAASDFALQAGVPDGWAAAFTAPVLSVAPGGSATTSLFVTPPAGTPDGAYGVGVTAANVSEPAYAGAASATRTLVSSLGVGVTSGAAVYTRTQKVTVTAVVRALGAPLAGATVAFTMTKPDGSVVTKSATTTANGGAVFTYSFDKRRDPLGTYRVGAAAAANGVNGGGTASFSVYK